MAIGARLASNSTLAIRGSTRRYLYPWPAVSSRRQSYAVPAKMLNLVLGQQPRELDRIGTKTQPQRRTLAVDVERHTRRHQLQRGTGPAEVVASSASTEIRPLAVTNAHTTLRSSTRPPPNNHICDG